MKTFHIMSSIFLFPLICFLSSIEISTARPNVDPSRRFHLLPQPPQSQEMIIPHSRGRTLHPTSSTVEARTFGKRMDNSLSYPPLKMKLLAFQSFAMIQPISTAARALEDFYSAIAFKASSLWATEPLRTKFSIIEGRFQLDFTCIGDTIPWNFVTEIANLLWECACMGMTDLFEAVYTDERQRIAVSIALRLLEGDPNSASSDSDFIASYREGSVPSVGN